MSIKFCPLMSRRDGLPDECLKESCGFFDEEQDQCLMVSVAKGLNPLKESLFDWKGKNFDINAPLDFIDDDEIDLPNESEES